MAKKKNKKKGTILKKEKPSSIDVNYIKTKNYRTYHVDGIFGSLTTEGIHIQPFVQRLVTPQIIKHEIAPDGFLGKEIPGTREGKSGIVREIESGLVMNIEVAKVIRNFLDEKIELYNKLRTAKPKKKIGEYEKCN